MLTKLVTRPSCRPIRQQLHQWKIPPTAPTVPPTVRSIHTDGPTAIQGVEVESLEAVMAEMRDSQVGIAEATNPPELVLDTGAVMGEVQDIAFSPDGRRLAVTGDKVVRIYQTATGRLTHTLRGDRSRTTYGNCYGVAFSPDGRYLVVGIDDDHPRGSIRLYRTDNLDEIDQLLPGHAAPTTGVAFSRDGKFMASNDSDGEILLWDWPAKKILRRIPPRNPGQPIIDVLEFAGADPYLLTVDYEGPHVYQVPEGKELSANDRMPPKLLGWLFDVLTKKVKYPYGTTRDPRQWDFRLESNLWAAAAIGKEGNRNRFWVGLWQARPMNRNAGPASPRVIYAKHRWNVYAVAISPAGDLVASGDKFGEVHVWDTKTGEQKHVIRSPGRAIYEAAFDNNSQRIAYGNRPDLKGWQFNHYGNAGKVIDLQQRAIRDATTIGDLSTVQEQTTRGGTTISRKATTGERQGYRLVKQQAGREIASYRLGTGRQPTVLTLLEESRLDVQQPVLFGDNYGYLAMWDSSRDEMQRFYRGHESMITSISPASNGNVFVTGSTDRTIRIWSLRNHKRTGTFDFKYLDSTVIEVPPSSSSARGGVKIGDRVISVDGISLRSMYERMMSGTFDYQPGQQVPVVMRRGEQEYTYTMTMKEGYDFVEPLLNVFIGDQDQWIMWTPEGYYDCSPGADRLIGWHVNRGPTRSARFYRVEQFKKQLYRPDIINRVIETGEAAGSTAVADASQPSQTRSLKLTSARVMADNAPPVARFLSPRSNAPINDPRINIEATVLTASQQPITEVTLLHNGTPAKVFKPRNADERQQMSISHRLKLFPGRNELALIATNPVASSAAEDARIELQAPASDQRTKVVVLAVGISKYVNDGKGFDDLKYAADDARAFVDAARQQQQGKLYTEVMTRSLLDEEATRANILGGLQWLVENVQAGDVVMLFTACHGFMERENFYLATHEVDKENLRATGVSWREILGVLHEELPACKRVVFLDACYSQGIVGPDGRSPLHDLSSPELGTIFYASSTFQQQSFESDQWRHGAFTKAILDTVADPSADFAPRSGDGLINALELQSGVAEKVKVMTGDRQHPVTFLPYAGEPLNLLELLSN